MLVRRIDAPRRARGYKRLVEYLLNPKGLEERVAHVLVSNCHSTEPDLAVAEVLATQHLNLRTKWSERTYHLLFAFPLGELPELAVLHNIERALCEAIGVAEHQRISVVHVDTNFLHVHVAINTIHPTTLKKAKLSYDEYRLQDAAAELEHRYGLRLGRHRAAPRPLPDGAAAAERHGDKVSLVRWLREHVASELQQAPSWQVLHRIAARYGLRIERQGGGLVIVAKSLRVKASSVARDLSLRALEQRLQSQFEVGASHDNDVIAWEQDDLAALRAAIGNEGPRQRTAGPDVGTPSNAVLRDRAGERRAEPARSPDDLERWGEGHVAAWKGDNIDDPSLLEHHAVAASPAMPSDQQQRTAASLDFPRDEQALPASLEQVDGVAQELASEAVTNGMPPWAELDYGQMPDYASVGSYDASSQQKHATPTERAADMQAAVRRPPLHRPAERSRARGTERQDSENEWPRRQQDAAERARLWSERIAALVRWENTQKRAQTLMRQLHRLEAHVKARALDDALRSLTRQREVLDADGVELSDGERKRIEALISGLRRELDALGGSPHVSPGVQGNRRVRIIRMTQWRLYAAYRATRSPLEKLYRVEQSRLRRARAQQLMAARELYLAELRLATELRQLQRYAFVGLGVARVMRPLLSASARGRIARVKEEYARRQHEIRVLYRPLGWVPWLQKRALEQDAEALRVLRTRATPSEAQGVGPQQHSLHDGLRSLIQGAQIDAVTKVGTVIYKGEWAGVRDRGLQLDVTAALAPTRLNALVREAVRRFGTNLRVVGNADFVAAVRVAADTEGLIVSFVQEKEHGIRHGRPGPIVWAERYRRSGGGATGGDAAVRLGHGGNGRGGLHQPDHPQSAHGRGTEDGLHQLPGSAVDAAGAGGRPAKAERGEATEAKPRVLLSEGASPDLHADKQDAARGLRRARSSAGHTGSEARKSQRGSRRLDPPVAPHEQAAEAAAKKYIAEREAKRRGGLSDIPEHRQLSHDASGQYELAGRRRVDGVDLVLLKREGVVFVADAAAVPGVGQRRVGQVMHVRRGGRKL